MPLWDLLRSSSAAAACLERQRGEDGLLGRVRDLLDPAAQPHCVAVKVTDAVLTLTVDSPVWATRLRYRVPDLLGDLGESQLREVRLHTRPQSPDKPAAGRVAGRSPRLTAAAAGHLLAAAEGCAVPAIGEIFRRLARRRGAGAPDDMEV